MIINFKDFSVNEMKGANKDANKSKEILNNLRNIMMLKPEMNFISIMYNALETTDTREMDDEDILAKLQKYELFLKDAAK